MSNQHPSSSEIRTFFWWWFFQAKWRNTPSYAGDMQLLPRILCELPSALLDPLHAYHSPGLWPSKHVRNMWQISLNTLQPHPKSPTHGTDRYIHVSTPAPLKPHTMLNIRRYSGVMKYVVLFLMMVIWELNLNCLTIIFTSIFRLLTSASSIGLCKTLNRYLVLILYLQCVSDSPR